MHVMLTLSQMNIDSTDDSRALQCAFVPCMAHYSHMHARLSPGDQKSACEQGLVGQFSSLLYDVIV